MRGLLFEAFVGRAVHWTVRFPASPCVIGRVKRFSPLKSRAVRLAGWRGFRKAAVATARRIAVLMLTLWQNDPGDQWTKEATA